MEAESDLRFKAPPCGQIWFKYNKSVKIVNKKHIQ